MNRTLQALRLGFLCTFLFLVLGTRPSSTAALGLCSMEYCDCTSCQCQGMVTCCESVCGECWADLACGGGTR
jgi:hypothetical protein